MPSRSSGGKVLGPLMSALAEVEAIRRQLGPNARPDDVEAEIEAYLIQYPPEAQRRACKCGRTMRWFEMLNRKCEACRLAAIEQEEQRKPSVSVLEAVGVPPRFREYTLLNWRTDLQKIPERALTWVRKGTEPFCVITGGNGTGKTHLACVLLAEAHHARQSCGFAIARQLGPALADDARVDGRPEWQRLSRVQVLVVDDLRAEPDAAWAVDKVVGLIDARYVAGLRTIITSNVSMDELLKIDPRLGSRLHEGVDVELRGPDRRIVSMDEHRSKRSPNNRTK